MYSSKNLLQFCDKELIGSHSSHIYLCMDLIEYTVIYYLLYTFLNILFLSKSYGEIRLCASQCYTKNQKAVARCERKQGTICVYLFDVSYYIVPISLNNMICNERT